MQIGAPKELRIKLDDITKKFQRFQVNTTRIGDDPSLDFLMVTYRYTSVIEVIFCVVHTHHFPRQKRSYVFQTLLCFGPFGTEVVRGLAGEVGG